MEGRQCASIVREEVGEWERVKGRQCASVVREEVGEWVGGGGDRVGV